MKILIWVEKCVIWVVLAMLLLVILASTIEAAVILFRILTNATPVRVDLEEILPMLGGLMLVLIGIELLHTIKIYLADQHLHVEVVILVAMIAIARKVIILDYKEVGAAMVAAIGALFVGLAAGYWLLRKADASSQNKIHD